MVDEYRTALGRTYGGGDWSPPGLDPRTRADRDRLASRAEQLLGVDRFARLQELSWRILDGTALADDDVATLLQLAPAQRTAIEAAARQAEGDNQRILRSMSHVRQARLASREPTEDRGRAAGQESDARLRALLTPEQRERFEQIKRGRS
jgi:hypothetical protein